jgi:hypothetical protein
MLERGPQKPSQEEQRDEKQIDGLRPGLEDLRPGLEEAEAIKGGTKEPGSIQYPNMK